ncbi:MAG: aminodeoxychorismate/anthranilate synthase component II [Deltaproteobacteria bacterium]|nr:aminodeoxychorismate/anthranilate synthase component II [Deltaproteobacteria bacterium]
MIFLIDNYDSFTYNLVQALEGMGMEVRVFRNDRIGVEELKKGNPSSLLISPGPGGPEQAGFSMEAIRALAPSIPVLGVCLGHQAVAAVYGGRIVRAGRIMHGKCSTIHHDGRGVFRGLPNPFEATRYHSLIVEAATLPPCLEVSAWTEEGEVMGLRHREYPVEGVQFHPESILTRAGTLLLENFAKRSLGLHPREEERGAEGGRPEKTRSEVFSTVRGTGDGGENMPDPA